MTYKNEAEAVLQSIFVALRESMTYNNTCQAFENLGLDLSIDISVTVRPGESGTPASADAKFLQDMHIASDLAPIASMPKASETPEIMPTTFTWRLLKKIANSLRRKG
jgi:hypothetical protein